MELPITPAPIITIFFTPSPCFSKMMTTESLSHSLDSELKSQPATQLYRFKLSHEHAPVKPSCRAE